MHDVEHAVGQPCFLEQARHQDRGRGHFFRRLQDEGVAARDRHREHPQRHHRRKIERRDSGAHADRLPHGVRIHPGADVFRMLSLEELRDAAGEFDDLDAALHRSHRVGQRLAVLLGDEPRNFLLVFLK